MIFTTDYGKLSDADLVIEAAFERTDVKMKIFAQLEEACPKTTILASNSSHMTPEEIFPKMKDKRRCLVLHYFSLRRGIFYLKSCLRRIRILPWLNTA
jgi:3-hydroxyacyl-CoA dehydrogenase